MAYTQALHPEVNWTAPPGQALLVIYPLTDLPSNEEDMEGQTLPLLQARMRIGRDVVCDLQIKDRYVSRTHATLSRTESRSLGICYSLVDGDGQGTVSSNGIFINGVRLQSARDLQDGDRIQWGLRVLSTFHQVQEPPPEVVQDHLFLGDLLFEIELISAAQLRFAQDQSRQQGLLLGEILLQHNWIKAQTIDFLLQIDKVVMPQVVGKPPVGEYLRSAGLVTEGQLNEAMQLQKRKRAYFAATLVEQGIITPATLKYFLSRYDHLDQSRASTVMNLDLN
ncbi:MAG: FHA domain-containing protein [Synechococcaceae cyanobacterium SM2_3_1]|nr:FHA domain-containing protein [Synechococcaceae cyanobacterium SM2_3_1]